MLEFMRTALYCAVVLCGVGYLTACVFWSVDMIERPKKRVGGITRARTEGR